MNNNEILNSDDDTYTLSDNVILEIIHDYIKDDRYKSSILIDGEWGSGKTFFIKEKLIKEIETEERKTIYITLNGVGNIVQVIDKICSAILFIDEGNLENKKNKFRKKLKSLSGVISLFFKDYYEILTSVKEIFIKKYLKEKKSIIVFDDIERCKIDIDELFGYINELAEHHQAKVILIANEKEIGNKELYNKIKEKLIGKTIKYKPDFFSIYEDLVECYIKNNSELKEYLNNQKQKSLVLKTFNQMNCYNIRSLIHFLISYEKIFSILQKIEFDSFYLDEHKEKILLHALYLTIELKEKNNIDFDINDREISSSIIKDSKQSIVTYKFLTYYYLTNSLDEEKIQKIICEDMEEKKSINEMGEKIDNLAIHKLSFNKWYSLDDREIYENLKKIKDELEKDEYPIGFYREIAVVLLQLENEEFKGVNNDDFINLMVQNLNKKNSQRKYRESYERKYFCIETADSDFEKKYNELMKDVFDTIEKKNNKKDKEEVFFLEKEKWDYKLIETSSKLDNVFLIANKFLFYANIEKIIERLKNVQSPKEIYYLIDAIRQVYSFSNLNEYYKSDTDNIRLFKEKIKENMKEISNKIKTREIALTTLQKNLEDYLERIEK